MPSLRASNELSCLVSVLLPAGLRHAPMGLSPPFPFHPVSSATFSAVYRMECRAGCACPPEAAASHPLIHRRIATAHAACGNNHATAQHPIVPQRESQKTKRSPVRRARETPLSSSTFASPPLFPEQTSKLEIPRSPRGVRLIPGLRTSPFTLASCRQRTAARLNPRSEGSGDPSCQLLVEVSGVHRNWWQARREPLSTARDLIFPSLVTLELAVVQAELDEKKVNPRMSEPVAISKLGNPTRRYGLRKHHCSKSAFDLREIVDRGPSPWRKTITTESTR